MLANRKHLVNSVKRTYTVSVLLPKGETAMHDIADEHERTVPLAWASATLAAHEKK